MALNTPKKPLHFAFKKFSEGPCIYNSPSVSPEDIEDSELIKNKCKLNSNLKSSDNPNVHDCTKRRKHSTLPSKLQIPPPLINEEATLNTKREKK